MATPNISGSDGAGSGGGAFLAGSDSSSSARTSQASSVPSGSSPTGGSVPDVDTVDAAEVSLPPFEVSLSPFEVSLSLEAQAVEDGPSGGAGAPSDAGLALGLMEPAPAVAEATPVMTAARVGVAVSAASGLGGPTSGDGPRAPVADPGVLAAAAYARREAGDEDGAS